MRLFVRGRVAGPCGAFAGLGGQEAFIHDDFGGFGIFFQVLAQVVAHGRVDYAFDFAVAELGFGLAFELRLRHAEGDDGGEALAAVVAAGDQVFVLPFLFAVGVDGAGNGGAEAGDVGSALGGADVVHVGMDVFGIFGRILDGHFQAHAFILAGDIDDIFVGGFCGAVQVLDEF